MTNFQDMHILAHNIVRTVEKKDADYGSSWKARGGVGAFMMAARKWDRIENMTKQGGYDIFRVLTLNTGDIADDIDDLIGYLLLIRENCLLAKPTSNAAEAQKSANYATSGYAQQENGNHRVVGGLALPQGSQSPCVPGLRHL